MTRAALAAIVSATLLPAMARAQGLPGEGCEVRINPVPGPVTDPSGPYYHQVVVARTTDGVTLTAQRQVLDHASVPDGVRMPDGTVRIYYVNGAEHGVWVARVDGEAVTPLGPILIDGVSGPLGVVDPDALVLPDGRVLLFYLSGFGPPGTGQTRAICVAASLDGERFTVLGRALRVEDGESLTDPSVAPLPGGGWLMAVSQGQQTLIARSSGTLAFDRESVLGYGGVPEVAAVGDGSLRLYVCGRAGIESYRSGDLGRSWQAEAVVVPMGTGGARIVCDPSRVAGTDLFLYKTQR